MYVEIQLVACLRQGRFKNKPLELSPGSCINKAISVIGIPRQDIGIILLNNQHAPPESSLQDGDTLTLLPLIGGG